MRFLVVLEKWSVVNSEHVVEADDLTVTESGLAFYRERDDDFVLIVCFAPGVWKAAFELSDDGTIPMKELSE